MAEMKCYRMCYEEYLLKKRHQLYKQFESKYLPRLKGIEKVKHVSTGQYALFTKEYGIVDIFPATDNVRIRKGNQFIRGFRKWLKENNYV